MTTAITTELRTEPKPHCNSVLTWRGTLLESVGWRAVGNTGRLEHAQMLASSQLALIEERKACCVYVGSKKYGVHGSDKS